MIEPRSESTGIPRFERRFLRSREIITRIGDGALGGKARGLVEAHSVLDEIRRAPIPGIEIEVPRMVVVTTDVFDAFVDSNHLHDVALSDLPDARIAHAFQGGDMPAQFVGDLRALVEEVRAPLAIRSSSLLEDARERPFAGVYGTKMTPNNQPDVDSRYQRLIEALKFVFASTYFRSARTYRASARESDRSEKMAVVIQEVVGQRHHTRFYPDVSGVCRTFGFYPVGGARPDDAHVSLALGLGKSIVDGGAVWSYSPVSPGKPPPFQSAEDRLQNTQRSFWAIDMSPTREYDPINEIEYLERFDLATAEYDGTLRSVASTYDMASDRLVPGTGGHGARVIDFAPILVMETHPVNAAIERLLTLCENVVGPVEIECALTLPARRESGPARLGLLQVRPLAASEELVEVTDEELERNDALVVSESAMGNGVRDTLRDIVYVKPQAFEARHTGAIAAELEATNRMLVEEGREYVLIGFGRWGSSDPWLGIPVGWGDVAGARAIVEASLPGFVVDPSRGAHFFHNMTSFEVLYMIVRHSQARAIDWDWLSACDAEHDTRFLRHVRLPHPLDIRVDGRTARGGIWRGRN